jgi:hypothetical protein
MKRDFDLAENEVSSLENEVIARLLAVPTADLDGDFSLDPKVTYSQQNLVQWICTPGNKGLPPPETVRTEAARVHFWVREQCLATVRDGGVCSARAVVTAVGLPPLLIEMALGQLSKAGIIRSVGALSEKPGFSLDATYQRHDPTYKDRFNEVLEHMKRDVDGKKEIPLYLWPLIRLTNQLLVEANHPDREQDWVLLKARSQETGPGGAASVSDPDADNANGEDELKVILGETALSDRRLTDLIRTVFAAIARNQSLASIAQENMASVLPFRAGRTRYLVSLAPKHANDKEFACSIKLTLGGKTVYVESNWVRSDGVFHLQNFLDALGIGKPADSEVAKSDEPDEDTGDDDRGLIATMPTGEECPILGKTVPLFLTKLLKVLCKRQMADDPSKFLIDDVELPFAMGHVRFFMAEAPFHRDKRAFTRPVEQAGVFAEASLSWEAAIEQGRRVCKAIGVSVEPFQPHRIVLAIRLQDGALIAGDGTKEFMTELLDFLRKEGLLERAIGGTLGSNRNVMSAIPSLPSRKAVSSSVKYSYGDQTVYAPGQKGALIDYAQRVLGELGVDVIDVGEHALRWEQHVDTPSEPVAAEASPDVGV